MWRFRFELWDASPIGGVGESTDSKAGVLSDGDSASGCDRPARSPDPSRDSVNRLPPVRAASLLLAVSASIAVAAPAIGPTDEPRPEDRISVGFPESASSGRDAVDDAVLDGAVLIMLLPATRPIGERPASGPWWDRPHPFGVIEVASPDPGAEVLLSGGWESAPASTGPIPNVASPESEGPADRTTPAEVDPALEPRWYPGPPEALTGRFRVQAVFRPRADPTPGGPGEWRSRVVEVELRADREDRLDLVLEPPLRRRPVPDRVVGPGAPPDMIEVELPSPMLEAADVEPARHRAWVVLPHAYHDLRAARRIWPAIYVVPHQGDGRREAEALRDAIALERTRASMPQAVWIVIDPTSPWGHHHLADSAWHGPRATALVEEFIPELERRHRLVSRADGRLLVGHGAGGWSAIRLQLDHPDRFAKAVVTSPELVDLSRLGWLDAYGEEAFTDAEGVPRPAYREIVGDRDAAVRTVIEQEWAMAEIADPAGRSGNRWHRWAALASPRSAGGDRPPPLFGMDGRIDRDLAEAGWLPLDLAAEVVREPRRLIPIWTDRIHVWVGSLDEFGHERSLLSLQTLLSELSTDLGLPRPGRSVVSLVSGATFDTVVPNSRVEAYRAMIEHLEAVGLAE